MAKKRAEPMPETTETPKPKSKVYGNTPTQIRLTDEDKVKAERIRVASGLPTLAAAIRNAIHWRDLQLEAEKASLAKPNRKPKEKSH